MYRKICVPLDDSVHARRAAERALSLAAELDARITAVHVDPRQVAAGRRDKLIAALPESERPDLQPIDTSSKPALAPADWLAAAAIEAKVPYELKVLSGRPHEAILDEVTEAGHDLMILGAVGQGVEAEPDSERALGSLTERLVRRSRSDLMVVRESAVDAYGPILACVDGSAQSYAALQGALAFGKSWNRTVEAVAVYDPYLHYTLFNGIVNVLSEKASKVFKFKDQEKLHEEIIDTGLAKIYQAHLEVARTVAAEEGVDLGITLLDGKAYQKVLKHAQRHPPSLVVMGRIGVHSDDRMDVGSTSENLLRQLDCSILISSRKYVPPIDIRAQESVQWVPEAEEKMSRVPAFVRGVARTAVVRWAMERGHSVITPVVINSCMGDILPRSAAQAMGYVAEEFVKVSDDLSEGTTFVCGQCGYASKDYRPVQCPVCKTKGQEFQQIDRQAIESLGELDQGAIEVETTFDGKKLSWTTDAKDVLRRVPNGYERRRAKARIEKTAKVRGLSTVTREFALDMVQQEVAEGSYLSEKGERLQVDIARDELPDDEVAHERSESPLPWTDAAWKRICRVPEGFMRDMTREKVEEFAAAKSLTEVNLELCEEGIAEGRRMMAEMMANYSRGGSRPGDVTNTKPAGVETDA